MIYNSSVIFVRDIEIAKSFYTGLLGCTIEHDFGKNVIFHNGLAIWQIQDDHTIARQLITSDGSNRFELYFETESLDKDHKLLTEVGVKFLHEIKEEAWGQRTIRFFDPDNHLVEIGDTMRTFVLRLFKQGLTTSQISDKSGINIEIIKSIIGE